MNPKSEFPSLKGHIFNRSNLSNIIIKHSSKYDEDNDLIPDEILVKIIDKNDSILLCETFKFDNDDEYDDLVNFIKDLYEISNIGDAYSVTRRIVLSSPKL